MNKLKTNILVIEDEPQVRESYIDMFSFFGYDVQAVSNGREGLALINKNGYDIVVTDLNMPEMDGLEVLQYLKKKKPYIEVIVITGFATLENAIKAMKMGAYDYVTKPVDIDHVRIVLAKCVQQIKSKQENEELRKRIDEMSAPEPEPKSAEEPKPKEPEPVKLDEVDFLEGADVDDITRDPKEFNKLLPEGVKSKGNFIYSIFHDQQRVGMIWLAHPYKEDEGYIYDFNILDNYQGHGYGKEAMKEIEKIAKKLGMTKIELHVFGQNQVARNLYEKMGYEITNVIMAKSML